ncbi:lipase family protein [Rhodococcus gannanensis]|uniref:Lipase family protein n=1 Tax=Rhodococcus gannanensis TaxID=1960308 RepID=A0ABW4P4D5_9NOCA
MTGTFTRCRAWVVALCAAVGIVLGVGPAAALAQAMPTPADDPFYSDGADLGAYPPGEVLRTRDVQFVADNVGTPFRSTQVLYRSTDENGNPTTAVTTVVQPLAPIGSTRIVSFHMFYDGLGAHCDPSYTLRGNNPSASELSEEAAVLAYLAAGQTVVIPDYEGPQRAFSVGRHAGRIALDGIRAAETYLGVPSSTPVGMIGYSGGATPTAFAAELAPTYAPELNIVGAAAGGLLVSPQHTLEYVNGRNRWSAVLPGVLVGYQRAYGFDTDSFLSPYGRMLVGDVADKCLLEFRDSYPGLTDASMVRSPYRGFSDVPALAEAMRRNEAGTAGTPRVPLLLSVGNVDGQGDGAMVARDVADLAEKYCRGGAPARFQVYSGMDHSGSFVPFQADAAVFLAERFAGVPPAQC